MRRSSWLWLFVLALIGAACGGGGAGPDTTTVDSLPEPEATEEEPDGADPAELDAAAQLAAALSDSGDTDRYSISTAQGQTIRVDGIGLRVDQELEPDNPASFAAVDGARTYTRVDMKSLLAMPLPGPIVLTIWTDAETMTVDTRDWQVLLDAAPAASLGPYAPGVATVDLTSFGDSDGLLEAIVGSGPLSLRDFTTGLTGSLADVESDGEREFRGTLSQADFLRVQGQDPESIARSAAAGLALNLGVDVDELTGFYTGVYETVVSDAVVRLDDQGLLAELRTTTDMADLYRRLPEVLPEIMGPSLPPAEADLLDTLFADPVFEIEVVMRFDLDPEPIPDPPPVDEDRTAIWRDFLETNGFES